jgi:hypothetical protein
LGGRPGSVPGRKVRKIGLGEGDFETILVDNVVCFIHRFKIQIYRNEGLVHGLILSLVGLDAKKWLSFIIPVKNQQFNHGGRFEGACSMVRRGLNPTATYLKAVSTPLKRAGSSKTVWLSKGIVVRQGCVIILSYVFKSPQAQPR